MKLASLFALILAAFSLAAVACGGDDGGDAEAAVRDFYSSIGDKDGNKAYDNLSKDCLGNFSKEQFSQAFAAGLSVPELVLLVAGWLRRGRK